MCPYSLVADRYLGDCKDSLGALSHHFIPLLWSPNDDSPDHYFDHPILWIEPIDKISQAFYPPVSLSLAKHVLSCHLDIFVYFVFLCFIFVFLYSSKALSSLSWTERKRSRCYLGVDKSSLGLACLPNLELDSLIVAKFCQNGTTTSSLSSSCPC